VFGSTKLILGLDPELSDPLDADLFLVVLMAIDGKQQIGDWNCGIPWKAQRKQHDRRALQSACVCDLIASGKQPQ